MKITKGDDRQFQAPNIIKVVTHSGFFHADEIFAIAILMKYFDKIYDYYTLDITRTRDEEIISKAKLDKDIYVLDVGRELDRGRNNFDHHQNMGLQSAAGLVWDSFGEHIVGEYPEFYVYDRFIQGIDAVDTNRNDCLKYFGQLQYSADWNETARLFSVLRHTSQLIAGFNREIGDINVENENFKKAVEVAIPILDNIIVEADRVETDKDIWNSRQSFTTNNDVNYIILDNHCRHISKFKYEEQVQYDFKILPNPQGFALISSDTDIMPLPDKEVILLVLSEPDNFVFVHNAKFIAIFKTLESAIEIVSYINTPTVDDECSTCGLSNCAIGHDDDYLDDLPF